MVIGEMASTQCRQEIFLSETNISTSVSTSIAYGLDDTLDPYTGGSYRWSCGNPIHEPSTMLLIGTGLIGLAGLWRRSKKSKKFGM